MTFITVINIICLLLLLAYIFDFTSSYTKIPSVILLLLLGWATRQISFFTGIYQPDFNFLLPAFGTLGIILIVLEGSLELELNKSKIKIIKKSFFSSAIITLAFVFLIAFFFYVYSDNLYTDCLINAVPFSIISSAIAIPSVKQLSQEKREFVIFESSFSDIIGILLFTFVTSESEYNIHSFSIFIVQVILMIIISFVATVGLSFLLSKLKHNVKFIPIILIIILIYSVSEAYHLPSLIFVLLFGLLLGNAEKFVRFRWFKLFKPEVLMVEVKRFKELTVEAAFLVRSVFFILFGYLLNTSQLLNPNSLIWSAIIIITIYILRVIQLRIFKIPLTPFLYIAPRGLLTILLFLMILPEKRFEFISNSVLIQVIVVTIIVMVFGLFNKKTHYSENSLKID